MEVNAGNPIVKRAGLSLIKGVNKQIIEVSDIGNSSFERAILFVRPDSRRLEPEELNRNALEYLSGARLRPSFYPRRGLWGTLGRFLLGALIGAGVMAGVLLRVLA